MQFMIGSAILGFRTGCWDKRKLHQFISTEMPTLIFSRLYVHVYVAEQANTILAVETTLEIVVLLVQ